MKIFKRRVALMLVLAYSAGLLVRAPALAQPESSLQDRPRGMLGTERNTARSFGNDSSEAKDQFNLDELPLSGIPATGPGMQANIFYNVHVLGEVSRPGVYRILPSDRVTDALKYAGGVLPNGSERAVQLRRPGEGKSLDLYSYKFLGNLSQNPYLMENDVIFVPVKQGEFRIEGPVNRPGFYEIHRPVSLKKAIETAGGFSMGYSLKDPIRVVRFNGEKKEIHEVTSAKEAQSAFLVRKGDIVVIPHVLLTKKNFDYNVNRIPGDNIFYPTINNNVYVIGAVSQAGPYPFQPNFTYKDYVSLAGPQKGSSIEYSKIIDSDGKKKNAKKVQEINPGDTIVVPAKTITVTNTLTWINTLTSLALTSFVFYDRFAE